MVFGKNKKSYLIMIISLFLVISTRTYMRFKSPVCFRENGLFNDCIYYYCVFLIPAFMIFLHKFCKLEQIKIFNYFIMSINILIVIFYLLKCVCN